MPFVVPTQNAQADYPEYTFLAALTPSEQKAAFHVRNNNGNELCLKIIAPNYSVVRLEREILALQSISHPNVVRLREYTFSTRPGHQRHHIIEEFVAGKDLAADLQPGNPWQLSHAADVFAPLCDGLFELYKKKIVHRDLKPTNIRLCPDGSPVIIDFGLARLLNLPDLTSTGQGAAIGTPLYFAPEQFSGTKHDIDHRTDLFAVGVMLYQAVIGQHPFFQTGMAINQLSDAVCHSQDFKTAPAFTSLPTKWQLLIGRLLEKDRAKRPNDASQVACILRKIGAP